MGYLEHDSLLPSLMWGIWWEKNAQIFEGTESSTQDLKLVFFYTFLRWTTASGVFTLNSLLALLDSCAFHAS